MIKRSTLMLATGALILAGCAAGGVLDVSWDAPTTNVDGSRLSEVVSYRVYYSPRTPACPGGRFVTVAPSTGQPASQQRVSVRLTGLTVGEVYYVAIATVNSRGIASECSPTESARARRPND